MKDRDILFKLVTVLIVWIILAIVLIIYPVNAEVISNTTFLDAGESTTIFWGCTLGDDFNGTFVCEDTTEECINYTNITSINVTLPPGGNEVDTEGNCNYNFTCEPCSSEESDICEVSRTIKPGKTFDLNTETCSLDFECEKCDDAECDDIIEEYTTSIEYGVEWDGKNVIVNIDNYHRSFTEDEGPFSYYKTIDATCPQLKISDENVENWSFEQCLQYKDYFVSPSWFLQGFNMWTDTIDATNQKSLDWQAEYKSCEDKLDTALDHTIPGLQQSAQAKDVEIHTLEQDVYNCEEEYKNEIDGPEGWRARHDECDRSKRTRSLIMWLSIILNMIFLVLALIYVIGTFKKRKGGL